MRRRAHWKSTLCGALMVAALTLSGAAYAGWHDPHGTSTGGSEYTFYTAGYFQGVHLWSAYGYASAVSLMWNNLRGQVGWYSPYGNTGGEDGGQVLCGGWVKGIYGSAQQYVDSLGFICGDGTWTPQVGVPSDYSFIDTCPDGQAVHAVLVRTGSWMDRIAIYCS